MDWNQASDCSTLRRVRLLLRTSEDVGWCDVFRVSVGCCGLRQDHSWQDDEGQAEICRRTDTLTSPKNRLVWINGLASHFPRTFATPAKPHFKKFAPIKSNGFLKDDGNLAKYQRKIPHSRYCCTNSWHQHSAFQGLSSIEVLTVVHTLNPYRVPWRTTMVSSLAWLLLLPIRQDWMS